MPACRPRERQVILPLALLVILLGACRSPAIEPQTPTAEPTDRPVFPSFVLLAEGETPGIVELDSSELPISLSLASANASASILLYEYQGAIVKRQVVRSRRAVDGFVSVSQASSGDLSIEVKLNGHWTLIGSYLDAGNFLEIPGSISGSGPHVVYFVLGEPRYVRVVADPGIGSFTLRGIGDVQGMDVVAASTGRIAENFPLSPTLSGLYIQTEGTWSLQVVDRAELIESP